MTNRAVRITGFSLVELSVVLVILGLLVGGVLAGQSLIRAAELRAVATQYQGFITAQNAFRDKYVSTPGDMINATAFWGKDNAACPGASGTAATPGTCNGDGDGTYGYPNNPSETGEAFRYWQQLSLAGLITGKFTGNAGSSHRLQSIAETNVPSSKISGTGWSIFWYPTITINGGGYGNFEGIYGNTLLLGQQTSGIYELPGLKPEDTWNIDIKMDDGKPGTGILRVMESYSNCHDQTPSTTLPLAGIANYRLSYNNIACVLIFNL